MLSHHSLVALAISMADHQSFGRCSKAEPLVLFETVCMGGYRKTVTRCLCRQRQCARATSLLANADCAPSHQGGRRATFQNPQACAEGRGKVLSPAGGVPHSKGRCLRAVGVRIRLPMSAHQPPRLRHRIRTKRCWNSLW